MAEVGACVREGVGACCSGVGSVRAGAGAGGLGLGWGCVLRLGTAWVLVEAMDAGGAAEGHAGALAVGWASMLVGCERCEGGWPAALPCGTR